MSPKSATQAAHRQRHAARRLAGAAHLYIYTLFPICHTPFAPYISGYSLFLPARRSSSYIYTHFPHMSHPIRPIYQWRFSLFAADVRSARELDARERFRLEARRTRSDARVKASSTIIYFIFTRPNSHPNPHPNPMHTLIRPESAPNQLQFTPQFNPQFKPQFKPQFTPSRPPVNPQFTHNSSPTLPPISPQSTPSETRLNPHSTSN